MTTLKGIFPIPQPPRKKNYFLENLRQLRQMEKYNQAHKEEKEVQKLHNQKTHNTTKYQNVAPRVNSSLRGLSAISKESNISEQKTLTNGLSVNKKSSTPVLSKNITTNKKINTNHTTRMSSKLMTRESDKHNLRKSNSLSDGFLNLNIDQASSRHSVYSSTKTKYLNQSSQTLDTDNIDDLYSEGIIRYPSSRSNRKSPPLTPDHREELELNIPRDINDQPSARSQKKPLESALSTKECKDFVKTNKEKSTVSSRIAAQFNNGVVPTNYRKGVVPKYILERKEEEQQKREKAKLEAVDTDCPEGHIALPDNERQETLRMLKKSYQDYVNELNKMPIRSDTLRCQKKKMELEKQLNKLEEGIKLFSRPKVFVKIDE